MCIVIIIRQVRGRLLGGPVFIVFIGNASLGFDCSGNLAELYISLFVMHVYFRNG